MGRPRGRGLGPAAGRGQRLRPGDRAGDHGGPDDRRGVRAARVLMTTDAGGGIWTYADELAGALEARGDEVVRVALGPQAPPEESGVLYRRCLLEWQDDPWDDLEATGEWLLALADEVRPDVVHLNSYALAALPWRRPVVVVAHSCVLSWHKHVRGAPAPPEWDRYRDEVRRGLLAADAVIAPSAAMLDDLWRLYDLSADTGEVIHNGVTPPRATSTDKKPFVLGAGRLWDEAKGLRALDRAAASCEWPVEVAGDAGEATAAHARMLGVLPRDALRERMTRAAIFAHPARYEPFGLVALEAALARCALVLGDIPTLRELWAGAALFVPPDDPEALAATIDRVSGDEALCADLAAAAHARAQRHSAEQMAAGYAGLYESLPTRTGAAA